jgi:putative oxidoreductase
MDKWLNLAGRILLSVIFIISGYGKIGGYAATAAMMASKGIPGELLPLVILLELGGGIAIVLGFQTRLVALALALFCIVSGVIFHFQPGVQAQMINFMKNIGLAGGFLVLAQAGAPWLSIDAWRASKPRT